MFINSIGSSDRRFKTLYFKSGLNILVADRTESSAQGDSRNSVGKTSFIKILRYVMGGQLPGEFRAPELKEHSFYVNLKLPSSNKNNEDEVMVIRRVSPANKIEIRGWTLAPQKQIFSVEEWRALQEKYLFHIPELANRPTSAQLWGQLARTFFDNPIKTHSNEPDWESGVRIGHLLGFSAKILEHFQEVNRLNKRKKAIQGAVKEGAITYLSLNESQLQAELASARRQRDDAQASLASFKVEESYRYYQHNADNITAEIEQLNDEGLILERRNRQLEDALEQEVNSSASTELRKKLSRIYEEAEVVFPDVALRRYDEVVAFHESILRNRRFFLQQELNEVHSRLDEINSRRQELDTERAKLLRFLKEKVALDTFLIFQRNLAELEANVANLERRLEDAISIGKIDSIVKLKTAELVTSARAEIHERSASLDNSVSLFNKLGSEIYSDREAALHINVTDRGVLKITPQVSGHASTGVRNVETFMLDFTCLVSAIKGERTPKILVHDSHLFDAIDGRQIASCLNIGARLSDEHNFQYIVALNSDSIDLVEKQSDGAFDAGPYKMSRHLTDATEDGGLFGFRFN